MKSLHDYFGFLYRPVSQWWHFYFSHLPGLVRLFMGVHYGPSWKQAIGVVTLTTYNNNNLGPKSFSSVHKVFQFHKGALEFCAVELHYELHRSIEYLRPLNFSNLQQLKPLLHSKNGLSCTIPVTVYGTTGCTIPVTVYGTAGCTIR